MSTFLVCHGRPLVEGGKAPREWSLDPAGFDAIWALRESGRLPHRAAWFSAPEPAATETAQLLTDGSVGILEDLAQDRGDRVLTAIRRIIEVHAAEDVVLIGHPTAWTLVAAGLDGVQVITI